NSRPATGPSDITPRQRSISVAGVTSDNLQRFSLHGTAVGIDSHVDALGPQLEHTFREFRVTTWKDAAVPITGTIWPYEQTHVLRHMSPTARRVASNSDLMELYEEDERFWLVDDRWGITEINLLKGTWRSWILPNPQLDV